MLKMELISSISIEYDVIINQFLPLPPTPSLIITFLYYSMSFGIDSRRLKKLIDLYRPNNMAEEMKYLLLLKGEQDLFISLETCPFQGISANSLEDRRTTFGLNQLTPSYDSRWSSLTQSITKPSVFLSVFLSIVCFVLEMSGIGSGEGKGSIILFLIALMNWVLSSLDRFWFLQRASRIRRHMYEEMVTVVRENKQEQVASGEVVVGDMLEIKEGDTIPADGWLIEGSSITVSEPYVSSFIESRKSPFRQCVQQMKQKLESRTDSCSAVHSECSPVLIGGSQVKSGFGRMIILCVGDLSRQGALLASSQLKFKPNYCLNKVEELVRTITIKIVLVNFLFSVLYCIDLVIQAYSSSWDILFTPTNWENYIVVCWTLVMGLPQGLQIGILIGLWFIKAKLYLTDQIWVNYCEDITRMATVDLICFDKAFEKGKITYREWWNEANHQFIREKQGPEQQGLQAEEGEFQLDDNLCSDFKQLFSYISIFKECKQPHEAFESVQEQPIPWKAIKQWMVTGQDIEGHSVKYLCEEGSVRYIFLSLKSKDENQQIHLVVGSAEQLLSQCKNIISKTKGSVTPLQKSLMTQIKFTIQSMNRRFMSTSVLAYFKTPKVSEEQAIAMFKQIELTFVSLIGASGIKQHYEYQIAHRIRQAGVKMMLVSDSNLKEAVLRSKHIGVDSTEQETLALTGEEYMKLIGDVHCSDCKKSICSCQVKLQVPKVKNATQLRHVQRSFRILGQASPEHKYALMVGLENIDHQTAFLGFNDYDGPALANAYLAIAVNDSGLQGYPVIFKKKNIKSFFKLILWSRFSYQFVRKYVQLITTATLVQACLLIMGVVTCKQLVIRLGPLTWVSAVICPLLALALSWEKPSDTLFNQCPKTYDKSRSILSGAMKKQIVGQVIMQVTVLLAVMFTGHLWIPENADALDEIIGSDWNAKYSTADFKLVANGLLSNPLLNSPSYSRVFDKLGVTSRHLTVVFNIFALMQIFNCLNCRKIKDKLINILEGIQLQTVGILAAVLIAHFLFITLGGSAVGIYPYGLTLIQWFISIGMAASVWVTSFMVRLMPEPVTSQSVRPLWVNRSINLGVKLVGKRSKLGEFEIEEEIQLKMQ